jgi:hypothetical protein
MNEVFVAGNNLFSFYPGATEEEKGDILDCLLLADLQASEALNREQNWEPWIHLHQQKLVGTGLSLVSLIEHNPVKISKRSDFSKKTSRLIQAIASPRLADVAREALEVMHKSGHAQRFYDRWFSAGRSDNFQVIPCEKMPDGSIDIMVCGLQMTTRSKPKLQIAYFPLWPIAFEMTMVMEGGLFTYDVNLYAPHRARVNGELIRYGNEPVTRIDL